MQQLEGRIAVVTGGGTGMGRELVRQLAAAGCHVATCDVSEPTMAETKVLAEAEAPAGVRVTTHRADVSDAAQMQAFADAVAEAHATDHVHLLFNNAGIAGGGSLVKSSLEEWDRTFGVCFGGVLNGLRAFLPLLLAADEGHVVNTSSINGIWASVGPGMPHTAYSSAKFAVRGLSEALITDFAVNAPHLKVSVVMPGHIGTDIVRNTSKAHGQDPSDMDSLELADLRAQLVERGLPVAGLSDDELRKGMEVMADGFRDLAPMTAAEAATVILDGVRADRWRILVGDDAVLCDAEVRARPEEAYERSFFDDLKAKGAFGLIG